MRLRLQSKLSFSAFESTTAFATFLHRVENTPTVDELADHLHDLDSSLQHEQEDVLLADRHLTDMIEQLNALITGADKTAASDIVDITALKYKRDTPVLGQKYAGQEAETPREMIRHLKEIKIW